MEKLIRCIIQDLTEELKSERELLSLSLVGSFSEPKKKIEHFNDLDLVFIYDKITKNNLKKLQKIAKDLKIKYTTDKLGITHTFKIGPIKILSKKPKTISFIF